MRITRLPRPGFRRLGLAMLLLALAALSLRTALSLRSAGDATPSPSPAALAAPPATPAPSVAPPAPLPPTAPAAAGEPTMADLLDEFRQAEFGRVYHAYAAFQRDPDRAIPALLDLVDRDERVPLQHTADLIYPGATETYGHGWVVPYDIDWLSVRAGWALEELAFQDFGFRGDMLSAFDGPSAAPDNRAARDHRVAAAARAHAWWRAGVAIRQRDAILAALDSRNPHRRYMALAHLSNHCSEAPIPGLEGKSSRRDLEPRLRRLARRGSPDDRELARDTLAEPPWRDVCAH
jgi:hypothetical protein